MLEGILQAPVDTSGMAKNLRGTDATLFPLSSPYHPRTVLIPQPFNPLYQSRCRSTFGCITFSESGMWGKTAPHTRQRGPESGPRIKGVSTKGHKNGHVESAV